MSEATELVLPEVEAPGPSVSPKRLRRRNGIKNALQNLPSPSIHKSVSLLLEEVDELCIELEKAKVDLRQELQDLRDLHEAQVLQLQEAVGKLEASRQGGRR